MKPTSSGTARLVLPLAASVLGTDLCPDPTKRPTVTAVASNVFDKSTWKVTKANFDQLLGFREFGETLRCVPIS